MTKLMDEAIRALSRLPSDRQDEFARLILDQIAPADQPLALSAAEKQAIEAGLADSDAGLFADEDALKRHLARLRSV